MHTYTHSHLSFTHLHTHMSHICTLSQTLCGNRVLEAAEVHRIGAVRYISVCVRVCAYVCACCERVSVWARELVCGVVWVLGGSVYVCVRGSGNIVVT